MIDWMKEFETAHLFSWPNATICISNSKPTMGRNVFAEDKVEILAAAKHHGYKQINLTGKSISFIHPERKGERTFETTL